MTSLSAFPSSSPARARLRVGSALLTIALFACGPADSVPSDELEWTEEAIAEFTAELSEMADADQAIREGLSPERMQDTTFIAEMVRTDAERTHRVHFWIDGRDWPTADLLGAEASGDLFLIVQHSADAELQKAALPYFETAAQAGVVEGEDVALLTDRVRVGEGLPQRYGTQFYLDGDTLRPRPIEDFEGLDERRTALGMVPIDVYVEVLSSAYDAAVEWPPRPPR